MSDLNGIATTEDESEITLMEIGDAATLTEGQGGGSSEDKRRVYNS